MTIPEEAFYYCGYSLGNVALPKSVETIGNEAFFYCDKLNIINWDQLENLTRIGAEAFSKCSALTGNVVLSGQSSSIGTWTFRETNITSISFPDEVKLNGSVCAFCTNLEKITFQGNVTFKFPEGMETIGPFVQFVNCTALKTIDFSNCTTVPNINVEEQPDNDPFKGVTRSNVTLKVPAGMKTEFESKGWTGFNIVEQ